MLHYEQINIPPTMLLTHGLLILHTTTIVMMAIEAATSIAKPTTAPMMIGLAIAGLGVSSAWSTTGGLFAGVELSDTDGWMAGGNVLITGGRPALGTFSTKAVGLSGGILELSGRTELSGVANSPGASANISK